LENPTSQTWITISKIITALSCSVVYAMNNRVLVSKAIPNEKDLEVMKEGAKVLESFGIPFEVVVISAHRNKDVCLMAADVGKHQVTQNLHLRIILLFS
jgi:hypothetical protein